MEGYEDQERQRPGERELDGTVENYRERNGRQGTKAKKITYQHEKKPTQKYDCFCCQRLHCWRKHRCHKQHIQSKKNIQVLSLYDTLNCHFEAHSYKETHNGIAASALHAGTDINKEEKT